MSASPDEAGWRRRGLYQHLLLSSLLLLIALQPVAMTSEGLLMRGATAIVLVASVAAVASRPLFLAVGVVLAAPAITLLFVPGGLPTTAGAALSIATFLFLVCVFLYRISIRPIVTTGTISAALVVYLLFGLAWAQAFNLVERVAPGSFTGLAGLGPADVQRSLFYYSYVTLTTLGYGDISPVGSAARSLAITEALVGQLYLVVMVAGIVGMHLAHRQTTE